MLSHAWVSSFIEHRLKPGESWCCVTARRNGTLLGVLPVIRTPAAALGQKACSLRAPHDDHTFGCDLVLSNEAGPDTTGHLYRKLEEEFPSLRMLEFKRLPDVSPTHSLGSGCLDHTFVLEDFCGFGNFIRIEGTYDDFKSGMQTRFTRNLRRLRRKIRSLPDVEFTCHTDAGSDDEYLRTFLEIEASGWKRRSGTAILIDQNLLEFYRTLTRRLTRIGWLEWHFLRTAGRAIAGHLGIRVNRSFVLFKIAFDESYSSYSPGNVLFDMMLERSFENREYEEINCLSDSPWMKNWNTARRSYHDIYLFPMHFLPIILSYVPVRMRSYGKRNRLIRPTFDAICHFGNALTRKDQDEYE